MQEVCKKLTSQEYQQDARAHKALILRVVRKTDKGISPGKLAKYANSAKLEALRGALDEAEAAVSA